LTRATLMANPDTALLRGTFYTQALQAAASTLSVETETAMVRSTGEIAAAIAAVAQGARSGLIVSPDSFTQAHDEFIVKLAARYGVPAIYGNRSFSIRGGLMSYGPNFVDIVRRSAAYIDRILRGEKPADLPVQAPTKFEMVVNLRTAKALGLDVPSSILVRADEVIE